MRILLTNDDGVTAKGINVLKETLSKIGEVWTMAPFSEQSAKSHSFSMHEPLKIQEHNSKVFSLTGTPADCVYVGTNLLGVDFDVVVSGINHGANLGTDIHYSGTVAGAREGCFRGVPSIAVSISPRKVGVVNFQMAANLCVKYLPKILGAHTSKNIFYNLNVPDLDQEPVLKTASLGERHYKILIDQRESPRGHKYLWIGGPSVGSTGGVECDTELFKQGFATITPLTVDSTAYKEMTVLEKIIRS